MRTFPPKNVETGLDVYSNIHSHNINRHRYTIFNVQLQQTYSIAPYAHNTEMSQCETLLKCKHITQSLIATIFFISFIPNGSAEIRMALQTYAGLSPELEDGSSFSCSIRRKVFTFSSISSAEYLDIKA